MAILLIATCAVPGVALAQTTSTTAPATTQTKTQPRGDVRTLTVSPRAVPVPALKYPLRVATIDQVEGNAAPLYLQAFAAISADPVINQAVDAAYDIESDEALIKWVNQNAKWLDASVPPLIAMATLRRECDWGISLRLENLDLILPYLSQARHAARYLRLKFRVALARGEIDRAAALLRASSVLADHVDDGAAPLVSALVSAGVQAMCNEMHAELIAQADAPNLYWSLRSHPVPFVDLRGAIAGEQAFTFDSFPTLRKSRDNIEITAADWPALVGEIVRYTQSRDPNARESKLATSAASGIAAMASYVPAKAYYARTRGLTPEQVAKIEPLKVVATFGIESYHGLYDDLYKWFLTPYPQMLPGLRQRWQQSTFDAMDQPILLAQMFMITAPSFHRFAQTSARIDRTIAALTTVEAIRAYAAAHDGQFPATLDAIVETPAPMNPVSGRPFEYAVDGDVATIRDDGVLVDNYPLRYEVRLRR